MRFNQKKKKSWYYWIASNSKIVVVCGGKEFGAAFGSENKQNKKIKIWKCAEEMRRVFEPYHTIYATYLRQIEPELSPYRAHAYVSACNPPRRMWKYSVGQKKRVKNTDKCAWMIAVISITTTKIRGMRAWNHIGIYSFCLGFIFHLSPHLLSHTSPQIDEVFIRLLKQIPEGEEEEKKKIINRRKRIILNSNRETYLFIQKKRWNGVRLVPSRLNGMFAGSSMPPSCLLLHMSVHISRFMYKYILRRWWFSTYRLSQRNIFKSVCHF